MKITSYFIGVLCLGITLEACKNSPNMREEGEMVVRIAQASQIQKQEEKEFSFISAPFRTSVLSFRVGGPIERFDIYAGNYYRKGEVIAEIDSRDFRIHKERTLAVYQQAKAEYERIQVLYEKKNISASTFEKARADYISAKTAYETAANELEDTRLVAPFDGYVGEVYIEKFQEVKATQPVISFIDIDRLKIETYVTQEIAFNQPEQQEVELKFDALPDKVYKAKVAEVSKSTTTNNLSYLLTALLDNENRQLPAGLSGKMMIQVQANNSEPTVAIPQKALCHRPMEGDYVWTVERESGRVRRRKVIVGRLMPEGKVNVVSGLNNNETVVVSRLRFLSEGMKVQIADENQGG